MEVFFYVVAVLVIAMFWMRVVEALGWSLSSIFFFIEEKVEKLKKEFSPLKVSEEKDHPQRAGDVCSRCEEGFLQMEYLPFHPAFVADMNISAPWPYNLVCSHCHAVTAGEY